MDAAGIVFFGRFSSYVHEAMEHFFEPLEGGYARLIQERRVGLPAVALSFEFVRPLRYGETLRIEIATKRLGTKSAALSYTLREKVSGAVVATCEHTIVSTDLVAMRSTEMPADVRAVLERHL
ncbi:MAG: hotdog domain-containing protein [Polyangiaceae bacterium]